MANDKLTWVELRKKVAQTTSLSEEEVGQFLNALVDATLKGLKEDKQVKIKGIGTFALKAIAPRRSVNIATGESFIIEGYNKLTFNAESMLKESVEKRLETPKTEEIMADINPDPIRKLGEQADEIVDILAELGQAPTMLEKESKEAEETPKVAEEVAEEVTKEVLAEEPSDDDSTENTAVAEEVVEEVAEEVVEETATAEDAIESENAGTEAEPTTEPEVENKKEEEIHELGIPNYSCPTPTKKKYRCCKWICWVIAAIILLGAAGAGYYYRQTLKLWWECVQNCKPTNKKVTTEEPQVNTVGSQEVECEQIVLEVEEGQEVVKPKTSQPVATTATPEKKVVALADQPREYVNFIGIERVGKDSRLAWIAYKYYAQKDLWVFIYEANLDVVNDPDHVKVGQYIRIPELDEKYRNLYDPELRQLVDSLANKYLKK